jgi:hypothetical protein
MPFQVMVAVVAVVVAVLFAGRTKNAVRRMPRGAALYAHPRTVSVRDRPHL